MLEARGLTKQFHGITAVRDVSFSVSPGEILGYLGPNGSGKTTTVNMLTGLLQPTSGKIFLDGAPLAANLTDYKRRLGYVPELAYVYPHLSGLEYLLFVGRLRALPESRLQRTAEDLLELFGLTEDRHSVMASYSKGMRQKVLVAAALLHNPDILILDEPLSGLDVGAVLTLRSLIAQLAARGKIIFYSSHVLEVVEKICARVLILSHGSVIADDSVANLRQRTSSATLEHVFAQLTIAQDYESAATSIADVIAAGGAA